MNRIYNYVEYGSLYAIAGSSAKLYGLNHKGQTTDKILYLLDKVNEINNRELLNKYEQTQLENENELNQVVNSKYSHYINREPRNINGSGLKMKKQFRFNRK